MTPLSKPPLRKGKCLVSFVSERFWVSSQSLLLEEKVAPVRTLVTDVVCCIAKTNYLTPLRGYTTSVSYR